jgi:hypothetical protein
MRLCDYTADEWFDQMEIWYEERGRACPRCRRGNSVIRTRTKALLEYECQQCDLLSCRSLGLGNCFVDGGRKKQPDPAELARQSS